MNPNQWQFFGMGNMGDVIGQNFNIAAAMYPHLWAAANAEQARRDREYRTALELALRAYAAQSAWMWSPQFQYQVPAFW